MSRADVRPTRDGLIRALVLSVAAAAVPVAGTFLFPTDLQHYEALTWLLLLVPAFLWAYERGWRGVATALAAGMATLSTTYAFAEVSGRAIPDLLLAIIVVYVFISLAIGVFGERLGRAQFDAAAESLALRDALTGLPNRRHAELQAEMQFAAADRGQPLAVVLFDLDNFAEYNSRNGRRAGDGVLRSFASLLRLQTRRMDVTARYGPEEFISLLSGCGEEGALIFAARLQEKLRAAESTAALPTVSAGIACYRPEMQTSGELLQAAEQALLLAKRDGRDRVRVYGRMASELSGAAAPEPARAGAETSVAAATAALDAVQQEVRRGESVRIGAGRSVFLLTADATRRAQLGAFLRSVGFAVTEGVALTDTMKPLQQDFDLIIADVGRRGTPAADMIRQVRQRTPATRILGIPRRHGEVVEPDALSIRVDAHYLGLEDPTAFRAQLEELLAEGDALRDAQVRHRVMSDEIRALDRQSRLALAASEVKYRQVLQSVQEVIFSTDRDAHWTFLNPAWTAITGFNAEESLGMPLFDFVHPDDEPGVRAQFLDALNRRAPYFRHECRWRTRSGSHRWIELRLQLDIGAEGVVEGSTGVLTDVTERRRAEDALRRSEEYYRALIENSGDMMAVLNADATFRYLSPAIERVFGYSPDELVGEDPMKLVHPEDEAAMRAGLALVLEKPGVTRTAELRMRNRRGDWRHVEMTCRNLLLTPGIDGIVVNARDVSERVRAENALRESEQLLLRAQKMDAIGRLAGGVAHDFNNLLTAIHGHVDLLIADVGEKSALRSELVEVREAAERATSLTRQLLAFSRRQVLQPRVLAVNAVIQDMEKMLRRVIGANVALEMTLPGDVGHVRADKAQIEQVLLNLVVNSRDAMPRGGVVRVSTARRKFTRDEASRAEMQAGTYVVLSVEDTGSGMSPDVAAQAFEPFFTTKGPGGGTGLGLSTVYGIVKQSGGHVWLVSEPERGTCVTIALPAADTDPAADVATATPSAASFFAAETGQETILLVEDEKAVRDLTQRILERGGYRVLSAGSGREALAMLAAQSPRLDMLLTDVVMPEIGGQDLATAVRKLMPQLPVLFMSGYNEEAVLHDGVLGEGTSFLEKPFTPAALLERVHRTIGPAMRTLHGVPATDR
jgi:diguanylate cyclase (GGDEF)-like protein/PAS domain S-box-containing protein